MQSAERFNAPFLIESIKDILALGWFQRAEEVFLFQIQQEVGWLALSGSNVFLKIKSNR